MLKICIGAFPRFVWGEVPMRINLIQEFCDLGLDGEEGGFAEGVDRADCGGEEEGFATSDFHALAVGIRGCE